MQNAEGGSVSARSSDRYDGVGSIVLDIASLIERVQASMKLIESAIAIEAPLSHLEIAANVVVLDDVTPRYLNARTALNTCNASLEVTLHLLLDSRASQHGTGAISERDGRHVACRRPHAIGQPRTSGAFGSRLDVLGPTGILTKVSRQDS